MHQSAEAFTPAAALSIVWVELALNRWWARPRTVIGNARSPAEVLHALHARMTARGQVSVRWIDLIFVERHALGILYPHPVGAAWPGQPPAGDEGHRRDSGSEK